MKNINKEEYTARISKANPAQLVVINFELLIAFIGDGQFEKAKNALEQLVRSLNFEITLAHDFYEVYKYVNQLLNTAHFSRDEAESKKASAEAQELLETLLVGWKDAENQVAALDLPPVAGDSPTIYSGLTYGRDGQADEYIDDGDKKGFMA
ncbi:MAG: flagellar protein FliS [Defluviitaleaceae bacterium]|nr:flagellar protein FliS [Defluviitaleaceae bacterium]MCL2273789.1 flagellar protein FliS [Defluviitaleaceae bacterium]